MELIYYVSIVAQFLTYASFLSGAKVCHLIYQQKSCAKLSPMPFLAGLNCGFLWLRYGFIADEWEIIAVNVVGISCTIIYLGFFVVYSKKKSRLIKQIVGLAIFILTLLWSIDHSVDPKFLAGSLASLSNLVACASPMATIRDVLKTKCVASLPFPIIASSFVVSSSWLMYGWLKEDSFIVFTNIIAVGISGAQLTLFLIYPSKYPYEKLTPSNKKSYDLIRLLKDPEEDGRFEVYDLGDELDVNEIDTNQNYKETLTKIMGQIYSKRQQLSKKQSSVMLLFVT